MFELPEMTILSRQMNQVLRGKTVERGNLGNSPHKFVWYNRTPEEFEALTAEKLVGEAYVRGRWLFLPLEPDYILVLGECGGKMLFHSQGANLPGKYHLMVRFTDGTALTVTTQMWGAMELYIQGDECARPYIRGMRPFPTEPEFTWEYFSGLVKELAGKEKRSAKGLLTQDQVIPGLGNAIAQDILFHARLDPRHPISTLDEDQLKQLFQAILGTVQQVTDQGGRYDEFDLFGHPGGYIRLMDKAAAGKPCPCCGAAVKTMQYLGGSCYFCPSCQQ